ncbi:hypothetical protein EA473_07585 [Natrarchaeobius chitinivorans]|uniref:Uncharacterized protein n=1 Tax=Natrarchaeobius chitinivorans TaxID=1679083 RepID=A0A3N6M2J8_NATCH|nr:hypothetical protein EA473_07585 [Natrarchaeobius chitinivorans]
MRSATLHTAGQNCSTIGHSPGAVSDGDGREVPTDGSLTVVRQYQRPVGMRSSGRDVPLERRFRRAPRVDRGGSRPDRA